MTTTATATKPRRVRHSKNSCLTVADLDALLALVTAMYETLARGDALSPEQVIACYHDHILGTLWYRIWDYTEYVSRTKRLHRVAHDDRISVALEEHFRQSRTADIREYSNLVRDIRRAALR